MDKEFLYDRTLLDDELLPDELFTSQVAQIRTKENSLLSDQDINSLMQCPTYEDCIQFLLDKGWGPTDHDTPEELLTHGKDKTWALMHQLCNDKADEVF